jgi:hypothetical protein
MLLLLSFPVEAHVRDPTPKELAARLDPKVLGLSDKTPRKSDDDPLTTIGDPEKDYPRDWELRRPEWVISDQPTPHKWNGYYWKLQL